MGRTNTALKISRRNLIAAAAALIMAAAGVTVAFIITGTNELQNTFTPGNISCEVNETFNGNVKNDVTVKNTGNADAYMRAEIIVTWQDADGNVFGSTPVQGTDYTMTLGNGWTSSGGYYYWPDRVSPGSSTGNLIDTAQETAGHTPDGYHLCIEILASAIQADGTDSGGNAPKQDAWNR